LRAATAPEIRHGRRSLKDQARDVLAFKLLRYLNSAAFGLRAEIHSIPMLFPLLGERELRKWIAVVAVGVMADGNRMS